MAQELRTSDGETVGSLVADILEGSQKLIRQEMQLVRTEIEEEWAKAKQASIQFVGGIAVAGLGALFISLAMVHALNSATGLPIWACYVVFAAIWLGLGLLLLRRGKEAVSQVDFVPRQSAENMKEDVKWLKRQTS